MCEEQSVVAAAVALALLMMIGTKPNACVSDSESEVSERMCSADRANACLDDVAVAAESSCCAMSCV